MLSEKEIVSLIKMLDDPDVAIAENIISALSKTGKKTISLMEDHWSLSLDELIQDRIKNISASIIEHETISFFQKWKNEDNPKVLEAWFCIDEMCNPQFNLEKTLDFVNKLRFDSWKEMNDNLSTLEKCNILAFLFQKKIKFHLPISDNNKSSSYLISSIIDHHTVAPTAATILFQEIARLLNIDLFGLNVFEYSVLGYLNPEIKFVDFPETEHILFYLIFSNKISFVGNHQLDFGTKNKETNVIKVATPQEIIGKILYGLIKSFRNEENEHLEKLCVKLYDLISE